MGSGCATKAFRVASTEIGFSPSCVESFHIESVTSSNGKSQLVLVDEGNIRELIPQSTIEVTLLTKRSASGLETPDYQRRNSFKFVVSPNSTGLISNNINVEGNVYALNVGSSFGTWLKSLITKRSISSTSSKQLIVARSITKVRMLNFGWVQPIPDGGIKIDRILIIDFCMSRF